MKMISFFLQAWWLPTDEELPSTYALLASFIIALLCLAFGRAGDRRLKRETILTSAALLSVMLVFAGFGSLGAADRQREAWTRVSSRRRERVVAGQGSEGERV